MKNPTKINILMGAEGIKAAYEETLRSGKLSIVCLSTNYEQVIGSYFEREYGPRLYEKGRMTREILPDTQGNRSEARQKTAGHEVKFLTDAAKSESDMIVSDDSVTFISFDPDNACAIVVKDKEIVSSLQMQFEGLWKSL